MEELELAQRKTLFCIFAAQGYSPKNAVCKARLQKPGQDPEITAALLLANAAVRRQITKFTNELAFGCAAARARAGLERMAFEDAAEQGDVPGKDGSFHVASVRCTKDGETCYTFYDRLKALSLLAQLQEPQSSPKEAPLLEALGRAARIQNPEGEEDA